MTVNITENPKYIAMVREAIRKLDTINDVSPIKRAKELVKGAMGRSIRPRDPMFWPAGLLMLGLIQARDKFTSSHREESLIAEIDGAILDYVNTWNNKYDGVIDYIDDSLAGVAMVKMYTRTREAIYRSGAERIWDFVRNAPTDEEGSIIYNPGRKNQNIFADGVGQTAMFLSNYGKEFDHAAGLSMARTQLLNFRKHGMDKRSGLNYHGYELRDQSGAGAATVDKKGLIGWGRATGWLMMGLSEYLKCTDGKDTELTVWYKELADLIYSYTKPAGGFSWLLPATEAHLDTSATGMLLYGIRDAYGVDDLAPAIESLFANTTDSGIVTSALSSCDDFAVHYQIYGDFPWGQGAALMALSLF